MKEWMPYRDIKLEISDDNREKWFHDGTLVAEIFAHVHFRPPEQEHGGKFFPCAVEVIDDELRIKANTPKGVYKAVYTKEGERIRIEISFRFTGDYYGGVDFVLFERPEKYTRCRFYDMMVSGWSEAGAGIVFYPSSKGEARLTFVQMDKGEYQNMALSSPAGIHLGEKSFKAGDIVRGEMEIMIGNIDMWSPDTTGPMKKRNVAPPPARSYQEYLELWLRFTRQPGLWVELGKDMGMFHRGWYGFLSGSKKLSGVLYFPPDWRANPGGISTWNEPLIELAWGGSANLVVMETLFRAGDARAQKILNALLYFNDGGFMHENGSWINGFQVARNKFSDRYGREHSEVATGGVVNYMMWRCIKRGFVQEKEKKVFTGRLEIFCGKFLESLRSGKTGGIAFSRFWDGRPGASRQWTEYPDECYPVSDAFGACSYLIAYKLTGKSDYLEKYKKLLIHLLKHLQKNEWRFMEYDTLGADAVAPSWILLILEEAIENGDLLDKKLFEQVLEGYHKTYRVLHSFLREREDYPDAEWKAAEKWGGKTITQGGIMHGSTAGGSQGAHSVHLRFDFPLAMAAYAKRTGNRIAMTDWESYLNWTTWLQYTDPRWPDVIGASTEHITFCHGYVQDTAQIKHGNPIAMLEWMEYKEKKQSKKQQNKKIAQSYF